MKRHIVFSLVLGTVGAFAQLPVPPTAAVPTAASDSAAPGAASNSRAWETLSKGLEEGDAAHRKQAIAAIGTIGPVPKGVQMVEKALHDKDTLVRQAAAAALGDMGSADAIPALKAALDDGPEVSFTAAKSLWNLGDYEDSREIMWQVLEGERKDTPGFLTSGLRDAKHKLTPGQLALMGVTEAAGLLGPASIAVDAAEEALKANKKGGGEPGRVVAVGILAKDSQPYALTLLEWALGDNSWAVRVAVAKALGDRGNSETAVKLTPLLIDGNHAVRYMASAAIIKLNIKSTSDTKSATEAKR